MGQRTNTAKLDWLVYNVLSYGIIVDSLSDRACVAWFDYRIGYIATPVPVGSLHRLKMFFFCPKNNHIITKNWIWLQITLNKVNILNWREPHQFSPIVFRLVLRQRNWICRREKVTTPGSQNLACLVRLYSGGQWTIAEAKLASSLCIGINRRCPFPLCYFIPRYD